MPAKKKSHSSRRALARPDFSLWIMLVVLGVVLLTFVCAYLYFFREFTGKRDVLSSENQSANPFGLMAGYDVLNADVKESFGVAYYRLGSLFYQGAQKGNETCKVGSGCDKAKKQGLGLLVTVRFNGGVGTPSYLPDATQQPGDWYYDDDPKWKTTQPYYNSAQMQPYKNWIKSVVIPTFTPIGVVVENEEDHGSAFYSAGPSPRKSGDDADRYLQELSAACDAVREYNTEHNTSIFCSNGGIRGDTISKLTWFDLTKTAGSAEACRFIKDVFTSSNVQTATLFCSVPEPLPPQSNCWGDAKKYYGKSWSGYSNDALGWLRGCKGATKQPDDILNALRFVEAYRVASNTYVNFHWYNSKIGYPASPNVDTFIKRIGQVKTYLASASGKSVLSNEVGQRDGDGGDESMYVAPLLRAFEEAGLRYIVWYSIPGTDADALFRYPPLELNGSGIAFSEYVKGRYGVTPMASPSDIPLTLSPTPTDSLLDTPTVTLSPDPTTIPSIEVREATDSAGI